jgi:hypothetical protein
MDCYKSPLHNHDSHKKEKKKNHGKLETVHDTRSGEENEEEEREEMRRDSARRFFYISSKLPIELQMILCHRTYESPKGNVPPRVSEVAFRSIATQLSPLGNDARIQGGTIFSLSGPSLMPATFLSACGVAALLMVVVFWRRINH